VSSSLQEIKVYGSSRCNKTLYYLNYFKERDLEVEFLDVIEDVKVGEELRGLYASGKLNFPTVIIKGKKLRNPSKDQLEKWLIKKGY
jgi:arsenate reductase-like glutaredoxin family protein